MRHEQAALDLGRERDQLFVKPAQERVALKVAGKISRPGYLAGVVSAYHVHSSDKVSGALRLADVEGLFEEGAAGKVAVYSFSEKEAVVLDGPEASHEFELAKNDAGAFTVVPMERGVALLGRTDKCLGPAAIERAEWAGNVLRATLREGGEFSAVLDGKERLAGVRVNGRELPSKAIERKGALVRITGEHLPAKSGEQKAEPVFDA